MANAPTPAPAPGAAGPAAANPPPQAGDADASSKDKPKETTKKPKKPTTKKPKAVKATGAGTTAKVKKPTAARRKKPAAKSSTKAADQQALQAAAKAAQSDLAHSRANASYKRTDPLWYRIEDVLPKAQVESSLMATNSKILPEQVQIAEAALAHNGMTRADVTPQAMACLLEQARRYAQELLDDAQDYAAHAGGLFQLNNGGNQPDTSMMEPPTPSRADLMLASEMRPDHPIAITAQLPRLNLLANQLNLAPLPPIPSQCYSGIMLPPQDHLLTARTFDVVSGAHVAQKMIQAAPPAPNQKAAKTSSSSNKPGYGAARGTQISIVLKQQQKAETASSPLADPKPTPPTKTTTMTATATTPDAAAPAAPVAAAPAAPVAAAPAAAPAAAATATAAATSTSIKSEPK